MNKEITNYTIFWCDNERDRPYQCTVFINYATYLLTINIMKRLLILTCTVLAGLPRLGTCIKKYENL